ncbi:hypothetical protein A2223_01895 [Candidatus Falkowbacteria bacterium RIFOXYA2_FULL_35_8]|uniref:Uncharacterized protein n=1 Tax=Candidatus Falkowbacteria bacterium RIFOXYC2_FULL_36_12 TaxID=1798002 RepID=A0A1F5T4G9_9BACT|nr:MAG: hypothetical protein A2300_04330 [Candidatus Falkowbacteria bacterium RIFOXYB2_FULL_35_7]OGF33351.1 MAG: hypothetical protein A2478_01465 [Candidatus Falkowbacteria bacterium RIFOXYC2_FULL_36_12]OGF33974.1 MAG: hypothetical protein A2223_01895 [Candidatus Falkowbacteria bacterium RIFOXYA2_FULL_35_8]
MDQENKNKNKDKSLLLIIILVFIIIFVGWLFFIRLNFQKIDNEFKVESDKTTDQAIQDLEQGLKDFGTIFNTEDSTTTEDSTIPDASLDGQIKAEDILPTP